jgi:hypothetical protein
MVLGDPAPVDLTAEAEIVNEDAINRRRTPARAQQARCPLNI